MLIFFEKKGLKVKKKSLGATEFYEKNGSKKKNIVDFFVVI
jgi:predicted nucleic-acid-binding Zn-ribbon protein